MTKWTSADMPDLNGRRAIVTGANSGIGFETALELARHGAQVVMTARDEGRGNDAVWRVREKVPDAQVELGMLDLADLDSVRAFARQQLAEAPRLDVLVNNAGVMGIPGRRESVQGYELQFATNHLGHFALTGLLLPTMLDVRGSRVVTVSSAVHRRGAIHFDDLQLERGYAPYVAYGQSKLANALFTLELDRRLRAAGADTISVGAHPGLTLTNLQFAGPRMDGTTFGVRAMEQGIRVAGQRAPEGALPTLYAATAPDVEGGEYFGPSSLAETRGAPKRVGYSAAAHDEDVARRLWEVSEEETGVTFGL
jgi:NAD(P)-dependent dehydrogenase (short-subunit alcohol dehydrogenase family)